MVEQEQMKTKDFILMRYFHEIPDKKLALLSMVLLLIASFISLMVTLWTKCWFMLLVPITGFLVAAGYYYRLCTISDPKVLYFAAMQILLIVSPLLLAAANYECLGKAMKHADGILSNTMLWMPMLFLIFDIICLLIQLFGGSLLTNKDPTKMKLGVNLILIGIILALVVNVLFIGTLLYINSNVTFNIRSELWVALYVTMILLLVRNVYRFIEFIQSKTSSTGEGFLASHEFYMYLLDFSIIFVCLVIFTVLHYGFYL